MELEAFMALGGVPVVAALTAAISDALGARKATRALISIACGAIWTAALTVATSGEFHRIPALAILLGLAAANPEAILRFKQRENGGN